MRIKKGTVVLIVFLIAATAIGLTMWFSYNINTQKRNEQNEEIEQYIEAETEEVVQTQESPEETILEATLHVTEQDLYWDGEDGASQYVRFLNTDEIYEDGFLPYDEYGKMSIIAQEYLVSVGDESSDCHITETGRKGHLTFIIFNTEKDEYVYWYNWDEEKASVELKQ